MGFELVGEGPEWRRTTVRVRDMDLALHFYGEYAGLAAVADGRDGKSRYVLLQSPGDPGAPALLLVEESTHPPGPGAVPGFRLSDAAAVQRLAERARRAETLLEGPRDGGPLRGFLCRVRDPDGNVVEFYAETSGKGTASV